jgi:antitoxin component YwqK of YwqJK toxin-antitoxin module
MNINKGIYFFCIAISILAIASCRQREYKEDSRLVFERDNDINTRVVGVSVSGKRQGLWINYDCRGRIVSFDTYVNDSLTGESIGYFENGEVLSMGRLKNGEPEGEWTLYYGKDRVAEKGSYTNGHKIGIWEYYIEEGKLDKRIEYLKDGAKKIIQDNHLTPPVPDSTGTAPILDSNNSVIVE